MSEQTQSSPYTPVDLFNMDYVKQQHDFFTFHPDVVAPTPDSFDSDVDSSLATLDEVLQVFTVDFNDAYTSLRSDTPTCGPPSTITVSSESLYDSLSSHSDSLYTSPHSSYDSNYSFPLDLEMDFQRIRVDAVADFGTPQLGTMDPNSFGPLPPTPPRSPPVPVTHGAKPYEKSYPARTSYSDYTPGRRNSVSSDYYFAYNSPLAQATVSPSHISAHLPLVPTIPAVGQSADPRRKYKCTTCPRAFARAYNLKTHMATHDPNRLKPHTCPHKSCGRSFSRKHDLGRHLVSIHREDAGLSMQKKVSTLSIGINKGSREWCDTCGKGWVGPSPTCDCYEAVSTHTG
ncbi:hypothetical protein BDN72DRAFT_753990 [Pluteus cervinus]|uniref:Uncharacterized protein n=1 Tax=Pluteus cervinus TaxID=181527 RepID=A0ACD3BGM2_9AGAR|nr:hypothetical protein BDN72DRAFT_753990 [Pluteus cervinus]